MKWSAGLALAAAITMATVKALLAEDLWWPFAIAEYISAALLTLGAVAAFRGAGVGLLTAAWGFAGGLTWSTLFHHLERAPAGPVEFALMALLTTTIIGVALASAPALRRKIARHSAVALAVAVVATVLASAPAVA